MRYFQKSFTTGNLLDSPCEVKVRLALSYVG